MVFIDSINIYISSGRGGSGSNSFTQRKNSNNKFPDGGNGGNGGNIYFKGDKSITTFSNLKRKNIYKAKDGENGKNNLKTGKNGDDLIINIPIGTIIYDKNRNLILAEINKDKQKILVSKGGRCGYGNAYLKNIDNNNKKKLFIGGKSEVNLLHLELRLMSDIGIFGYPNVGKSTIINNMCNVVSKIGNYPFTTLHPVLGKLELSDKDNIIISDMPGIIEKASLGIGLGFDFLKHLLKTRLLFHVIDITNSESYKSFLKEILTLNFEIKQYNKILFKKKKWIILNKYDLIKNNYSHIFYVSVKKQYGFRKLCFNIYEYFKLNEDDYE
jgi:GTPase